MPHYCSITQDRNQREVCFLEGDHLSDLETLYDVHLKMDAIAVIDRKMRSLAEQASDGCIVYDSERSRIRLRGLSEDEVFAYAQSLHDAVEFLEERWKAKHHNA